MRKRTGAWFLVLLALLSGCRTTALPEPARIDMPPGLTPQQIEAAVVAGILNTHPPPSYDPLRPLPPAAFRALIWNDLVANARSRSWFPEFRQGNTFYAAVNRRGHYLRAAIELHDRSLVIRLVESRNLRQSENRIHKKAAHWLLNLEVHIRREIGRMSLLVGPGD